MRRPLLVAFALPLALLLPAPAGAQAEDILILDAPASFVPDDVEFPLGVEAHWTKPVGTPIPHNVVQDVGLFVSGEPTNQAIDFTVLPSAGTYHYYCEVHGSPEGGMSGLVRVPPRMIQRPDGRPFTIRWATAQTETGRAFDARFRVDEGPWRPWLRDVEQFRAVFGRDGDPVRLRAGHFYDIQVRSQLDAGTPSARSRWAPFVRIPIGS